jgi:SRSO17 transposase
VNGTELEQEWDRLVREHHFLGLGKMIGRRLKYLIVLDGRTVAALSFNGGSYRLGARDDYIGWSDAERREGLDRIVNNNRFVILPGVRVKNLASHLLSRGIRHLRKDWLALYGVVPAAVETFVDLSRHSGTCYRAANWTYVGETKGYGKQGGTLVYHGKRKGCFFRIIDRRFARRAKPRQTLKEKRWEALKGMLEKPVWDEALLAEAGIDEDAAMELPAKLCEFLSRFSGVFQTERQFRHFAAYVKGLLSNAQRKTIEAFAKAMGMLSLVRPLQNFMRLSKWGCNDLKAEYQRAAAETMSDDGGMFTIDGCDNPKKGTESVGVARQYCGRLGKVDSCQASVVLGYSSAEKGYCMLDAELYLPEKWLGPDYKRQRGKCGVPSDIEFRTKNQIAAGMLAAAAGSGALRARWVGVDAGFGNDPDFLDSVPAGLGYFAGVHCDQLVFWGDPGVYVPEYAGKGRRDLKPRTARPPVAVKTLAESEELPWADVCLGMGAKGPILAREKILRVAEVRDGMPGKDVWLYIREHQDGKVKYSLCNAPADTAPNVLRGLSLRRWPIEQCFEEGKDELGLDHYEGRSWNGWHRHMFIAFVAHLFLVTVRKAHTVQRPEEPGDKPTDDLKGMVEREDGKQDACLPCQLRSIAVLTLPMARALLVSALDGARQSVAKAIENLKYTLKRNKSAYYSHRKKRFCEVRRRLLMQ